ncbi:MAG: hypothetical protein JF612_02645, partial [Planctomycetia bacterium]|nr:hypothetical protein [Planctomycetia bacterium]
VASAPPSEDSRLHDLAARLLESDGQGGWRKNEKAATELEKLSPDGVGQLWPLLKDPRAEVRRGAAVFLLGVFDPNDSQQVSAFAWLLDDMDRMVRARALDAVKQCSHADQLATLPRLTALLDAKREDRADNRVAIARLCGSLKHEAADSLPALKTAAAGDPDAKVRSAALAAIVQVAEPQDAVTPLTKGLADKDAAVRLVAAARLRQLGSTAAPAAKQLATLLADEKSDVAEAAAEALIRIGAAAVDSAAGQLSSKSASARKLALICLARIGPAAKSTLPQIEKLKQDPDPQVRQLANAALKQFSGQ